ncbi:cobalamin-binding protein [Lysinibacillus macroides]|uniref:ABC transporter substrate-binding protein n=1 Tax=Lysinibacillus macroides TaxID=33935 RepID=A0A0M9DJA3_9BACI|nr:cobalamin-binding protein [Lysinibacillus macroides]KOY81332.1 ABC transporter substrate-binding protein [Lysinibacillus macroides]QPR68500.1 cobalamin-binding protein [Lysinibacillus macroides]
MRLISICPSNTELVAYLGLVDQLVGVDDFSDWPIAVKNLPQLGPDLSINMDALEALQPDLVLASLSVPGMEKNIQALAERSIPHIVFNANSLEEIAQDLLTLGKVCNMEQRAQSVMQEYLQTIDNMQHIAQTITEKPTLYWEWWPNPIFTPGSTNWLTEISAIAGGVNLFRDVELASVQTDWADVVQRKPDYIMMAWVGVAFKRIKPAHVLKRPHAQDLEAVKRQQLYVMEEWLYCRPSPRLIDGAIKLAKLLHPTEYKHIKYPSFL